MNGQEWTIAQALTACALLKKESISGDKLILMVEILRPYGEQQVVNAIKRLIVSSKFFPDISEIIEMLSPDLVVATEESLNRIWAIAKSHSEYDKRGIEWASSALSDAEKQTVEIFGGWTHLITISAKELPHIQRDMRKYLGAKMGVDIIDRNFELLEGGRAEIDY